MAGHQPLLSEYFTAEEDLYFSILPTATQYARNAIFSGLMPNQIARMFPDLWVDEDEEEGKNLNEAPLIQTLLDRFRKRYNLLLQQNQRVGFRREAHPELPANREQPAQRLRAQLCRHALARPHRVEDDSRAGLDRGGLPLHHRVVVQALVGARPLPQNRRERFQDHSHHRPTVPYT